MGRALLTPDELRRFDNDYCIIFEKGIKPIKAKKYYYFEKPIAKKLAMVRLNHNEVEETDRGRWRKFNPYNPYQESGSGNKAKPDLKVESLDDLFEDTEPPKKEEKAKKMEEEAPILPQEEVVELENKTEPVEEPFSEDIQKELEAKFDELFGSMEDDTE